MGDSPGPRLGETTRETAGRGEPLPAFSLLSSDTTTASRPRPRGLGRYNRREG